MKYISVGLVLLVAACAHTQSRYDFPFETRPLENSRTLNESYDDAWRSVIDHLSATSFAIDNFEKDSGLITLSFGASNISRYVDCGQWNGLRFKGNYTDFLKRTHKVTLSGKVNISVREISENKTTVRINARYVLSSFFYNHVNPQNHTQLTWTFDSGGFDEIRPTNPASGTIDSRRCQPTYFLENSILDSVSSN